MSADGPQAEERLEIDLLVSRKKALCAEKLLLRAGMVDVEIPAMANTVQVFVTAADLELQVLHAEEDF
jgi:hypothetical protein